MWNCSSPKAKNALAALLSHDQGVIMPGVGGIAKDGITNTQYSNCEYSRAFK